MFDIMPVMAVGLLTIHLHLPASHSLKEKRQVMQSLIARLRREFNVSVAELDKNDRWQSAVLGAACVANDADYVHGLLTLVAETVGKKRRDVQVVDYQIEIS